MILQLLEYNKILTLIIAEFKGSDKRLCLTLKYEVYNICGGNILRVLVLNGPNINMVGIREKDIYGTESYDDLKQKIKKWSQDLNIEVEIFQSNSEGEIIDKIQSANDDFDGIIINPGAYTHYSFAILDAIKAIQIKVIEVHISNIYKREEFRRKSVTAQGAVGVISGFSLYGYKLALDAFLYLIK